MAKIQILDNLTIQKIAAGEVIENPASIVKELIENSIDANSNNIIIEIKNGGKDYIRITDNGDGIPTEDLDMAFKRHSTSKLTNIEDIYSIMSLGFRGEALSSISNVAKVEVLSKIKDSSAGIHAFVEEGKILSMDNIGCPKGTTMIIRDLFYNLPVRQKFLKSSRSESNTVNDIINKLALGHNEISFRFIKDNRTMLQTNKTKNLLDTIYAILGKEFSDNLIPINFEDNYIKINGFISNNKLYRGNRSHQYLYINKRNIKNYDISKAIESKYKSLIPLNRFPIFVLDIELDPKELDINIHPTKQEIKFIDKDRVIKSIINVINYNLFSNIDIPNIKFKKEKKVTKEEVPKLFELSQESKQSNSPKDFIIKDFIVTDFTNIKPTDNLKKEDMYIKNTENPNIKQSINNQRKQIQNKVPKKTNEEQKIRDYLLDIFPIGKIFNTYIIAESKTDEKVFFIDQHAAHERIMYEKYKKEYEEEEIIVQQLISPEIIEVTNTEISKFKNHMDIFIRLGFDVEEFGSNSIALRGVPLIFGIPSGKTLFLDVLDNIDNINTKINSGYDTKIDKIMKIACTNSIKSGDQINNIEILELFKNLHKCLNPYTCPHGRPTMIEITKKDIEKEFLRIM